MFMFFWVTPSSHWQLLLLAFWGFLGVLRFCLFCLWCDIQLNDEHDLYFRPFGSCAEVLTPGTVEEYFLPVIVSCFCLSYFISQKLYKRQKVMGYRNTHILATLHWWEKFIVWERIQIYHSRKYHNMIILLVCHLKILHKHCFQFLLGPL